MPLVKRQSGWFWCSKGPFDSRSKALAVARAAYAFGYKEQASSSNINESALKIEKDGCNSTVIEQDVRKFS
jgi:hypothetical protein